MFISKKISENISNHLISNNMISKNYEMAYNYCLEYFFDIILYSINSIILGILTHNMFHTLIFFIVFVPLKKLSGGYHAKSRILCSLISYTLFLFIILTSNLFIFYKTIFLTFSKYFFLLQLYFSHYA